VLPLRVVALYSSALGSGLGFPAAAIPISSLIRHILADL